MKKYCSFFIVMFLISCDITNFKLMLFNNTDKIVYFQLSYDTIITNNKEYLENSKIFPDDSIRPHFARGGKGAWEYHINDKSKDSTLRIFFFMSDTVRYYGWDNVINKGKFKRMDFKVKDLDSMDWAVVYE
jgi:hypothetical protein